MLQQHSQRGPELRLQVAAAVTMTLGMRSFVFLMFPLLTVCSEGDPSKARAGAAARVRGSGSLWTSRAPEVPKPHLGCAVFEGMGCGVDGGVRLPGDTAPRTPCTA